jgi:outer membrane protein assembly factor BamB
MIMNVLLLFGSIVLGSVKGQIRYREDPTPDWQKRIPSVRRGNGVFLSPSEDMAVISSSDGTVTAMTVDTGRKLWTYEPPTTQGEFFSCSSGITFVSTDILEYMTYSIVANEQSQNPKR